MKRPKKKADALDPVDAELIRETLQSPGWQLIRRGIETIGEQLMRDLCRPHTENETSALRGEISALQLVLKLPQQLIEKGALGKEPKEP